MTAGRDRVLADDLREEGGRVGPPSPGLAAEQLFRAPITLALPRTHGLWAGECAGDLAAGRPLWPPVPRLAAITG